MLFTMYPKILVNIGADTKYITDIFRRVSVDKFTNNYAILETITIPDGYTVEQVADKYYSRPDYHWVILIVNEIIDVRKEWPMFSQDLIEYTKLKYGETGMYLVHHYQTTDGSKLVVDYDAASLTNGDIEAITNIEYEEELNDSKREIKILKPEFIADFVTLYSGLVR